MHKILYVKKIRNTMISKNKKKYLCTNRYFDYMQ